MPSDPSSRAVVARTDSYHVGDVLPVPGFESVPGGTRLLVSGPPMTGKRDLAFRLASVGLPDQSVVVVTTDRPARQVMSSFGGLDRVSVVDCTGSYGTADGNVEYVSSPDDLTGVGIGLAKRTNAIGDRARDGVRVVIDSVSSYLRFVDEGRVFYFLQILTGRFSAADYLTVSTVDPASHDAGVLNSVRSLFDGTVELRERDDGRQEVRVVGFEGVSREWVPYEG